MCSGMSFENYKDILNYMNGFRKANINTLLYYNRSAYYHINKPNLVFLSD